MIAEVVWWDLDSDSPTIETLERDLTPDTVATWSDVPGLAVKLWLADRANNRWGAIMVWAGEKPPRDALPPNRAGELIGRAPSVRERFDVPAAASVAAALRVTPDGAEIAAARTGSSGGGHVDA
jgi:trans-2,3-dihydro-3-hydroxyanthranilate isomerase